MKQKQEQEPRTTPLPPKSSRLVEDDPHQASPPHTHENGEDDIHVNPVDPDDGGQ